MFNEELNPFSDDWIWLQYCPLDVYMNTQTGLYNFDRAALSTNITQSRFTVELRRVVWKLGFENHLR